MLAISDTLILHQDLGKKELRLGYSQPGRSCFVEVENQAFRRLRSKASEPRPSRPIVVGSGM
jgi:hypothetical protein